MTRAALAAWVMLGCAHVASAQPSNATGGPRRFMLSGGLLWLGGHALGTSTATLRRNEPGTTTPGGFTLFEADTSLERAFGVETRLAYALTPAFTVEVGGAFSRPRLAASITQDPESEPIVLSDQRLRQFTLEGNLIWHVAAIELGTRATPYVIGGAGYLRQIDDDRAQVQTGTVGHVGGGVRYRLSGNARSRRALGVRGEARLLVRSGGWEFADKIHLAPAVYVLGTFAF